MQGGSELAWEPAPGTKQEQILLAAARVFSLRGFHQATVDEIAQDAGVGKGTIYLHFRSKEALLDACLRYFIGRHAAEIQRRVEEIQGGPAEQLRWILLTEFQFLLRHADMAKVAFSGHTGVGTDPEFQSTMLRLHGQRLNMIEGIIQRGQESNVFKAAIPARLAAEAFVGMSNGLLFSALFGPVQGGCQVAVDQAMHLFLEGIGRT